MKLTTLLLLGAGAVGLAVFAMSKSENPSTSPKLPNPEVLSQAYSVVMLLEAAIKSDVSKLDDAARQNIMKAFVEAQSLAQNPQVPADPRERLSAVVEKLTPAA